ncbi:DUF4278 domain-containing protein [Chroococcidiopsis sp. SAG 2025]|uniref:DUF4278 domain-containing protein n=1 Tax=Chroococcidiopsis sp. SAG 2025 TaxID=171389 RepID=UPI002936E9D7|nr:DUF4278 domain-containing protein [Chroococcidiopsis sp. SAG 2025]
MQLSYRGVAYERDSSVRVSDARLRQSPEFSNTNCRRYRGVTYCVAPHPTPTQVPEKLAIHQLIYRGITYYKLVY